MLLERKPKITITIYIYTYVPLLHDLYFWADSPTHIIHSSIELSFAPPPLLHLAYP